MSRLTPQSWQKLVCVFEQLGFKFVEQTGSHMKYEKAGIARPLVIPRYAQVGLDIITRLIRTASISRKIFLELLANC